MAELESLKRTLSAKPEAANQSLSVGGTYNPSAKHLPCAIAAFKRTHPEITVTFWTGTRVNMEKCLRDFEIDIALIQSPSRNFEFCIEPFADDSLTFFAHPAHPLVKKKRLDLADLAQTPLVVREGTGTTEKLLKQLKARGLGKLNVALRCGTPNAVKAAVQNNMGIGILFADMLQEELAHKDFKLLKFTGAPELLGTQLHQLQQKKAALPCR